MHGLFATFVRQIWTILFTLLLGAGFADATSVSLISGASGSFIFGQSYNETRALDVTVLSPSDLVVQSMTLGGIGGTGSAEAVIYDSLTHTLIASAVGTVSGGTVTVPISATLVPGDQYRIGFYGRLGSGTFFQPNFPYTDSSGLFQINGASQSALDAFPGNINLDAPEISMQLTVPDAVSTLTLLALGLTAIGGLRWSSRIHRRRI
jgi:hypothetical protein